MLSFAKKTDPVAHILMKLSPRLRLSMVIIGAVLIHLSLGTYHTFGNMLPYMASYMRNYTDPEVKIAHMVWIPTFQGCFPFAMIIGGYLSLHLTPRVAIGIGCFIMSLGVFLSSYTISYSFNAFFFTYGIMFGLGQGIAYVTAVAVAINWAPRNIGLVSGIVAGGFGISSSIFAPIQTELINPKNLEATKDGYFTQEELLQSVPNVFFKLSIVYIIMQITGLTVMCNPPSEVEEDESLNKDNTFQKSTNDSLSISLYEDIEEKDISMLPSDVLRSSTFYLLFVALFCCSFYGNFYYNFYKTFGETFISDDKFFAYAFSIGSIANALARIGWGFLTDITSFQVSLSIASCFAGGLLLTMPLTKWSGQYIYFIWLILMFTCLAATHALFITAIVKCFGPRYKATNYGFLILSTTLSGIMLALSSQYWMADLGYTWVFVIVSIFPFTAFILTLLIHLTPQGDKII
uniref:MFS domain-containing protein n=1 Tax=Parastrongyloides trichosuri TaxID=131310 RepID=A0A0N4ZT78_PARTI